MSSFNYFIYNVPSSVWNHGRTTAQLLPVWKEIRIKSSPLSVQSWVNQNVVIILSLWKFAPKTDVVSSGNVNVSITNLFKWLLNWSYYKSWEVFSPLVGTKNRCKWVDHHCCPVSIYWNLQCTDYLKSSWSNLVCFTSPTKRWKNHPIDTETFLHFILIYF